MITVLDPDWYIELVANVVSVLKKGTWFILPPKIPEAVSAKKACEAVVEKDADNAESALEAEVDLDAEVANEALIAFNT
jgi:hypothetical protein